MTSSPCRSRASRRATATRPGSCTKRLRFTKRAKIRPSRRSGRRRSLAGSRATRGRLRCAPTAATTWAGSLWPRKKTTFPRASTVSPATASRSSRSTELARRRTRQTMQRRTDNNSHDTTPAIPTIRNSSGSDFRWSCSGRGTMTSWTTTTTTRSRTTAGTRWWSCRRRRRNRVGVVMMRRKRKSSKMLANSLYLS
uniref:(northern house mosquito) hypothetical protein n=1 Tax=Culex pipiens TaxID=7175 RepID=A0A8D8MXX7_CULPI